MENLLPIIAGIRGIERLLVVLFAGLAIYFGFRLFLVLPMQNNQKGEIELPGLKVVLSKAGPGVFFVAFGSAVLVSSFTNPIEIDLPQGRIIQGVALPLPVQEKPGTKLYSPKENVGKEQERARTQLAIQTLNCFPEYAIEANGSILKDDVELALRDAKLALLRSSWDQNNWGDFSSFERWSAQGSGQIPEVIKQLYLAKSIC